jgi:uncharacterized lipoprotein YbaY
VTELDPPEGAAEQEEQLVVVQVVISSVVPPFWDATLHVLLEDVSRVDASAQPVAETRLADLAHPPEMPTSGNETRIAVTLCIPETALIDPRHDYAVRAWLDRDSDGAPGPGDLFSDQRHSVLTHGFGRTAKLRLGPPQHGEGGSAS